MDNVLILKLENKLKFTTKKKKKKNLILIMLI